jgi:UDP-glucose 4-epimerase
MRILVTGASGFVGSHLVRKLLAHIHSVVALLRDPSKAYRLSDCIDKIQIVRGSLEETDELEAVLKSAGVDAAYHLAWEGVTAGSRNDISQITGNVLGSLSLWNLLHQTGCGTFISTGSQAEYGISQSALSEKSPTFPVTAYGSAKLALGVLLRQLCATANMRFVWLRIFSLYGPSDDPRHMVPALIDALMKGRKPSLTAGEQRWDFLYVLDAVEALYACLQNPVCGVFNLGSGTTCVLREFIAKVRDHIDPSLQLGFGEMAYRPDQVMHLEADISALCEVTGWEPEIGLDEGIRRTIDWHLMQGLENAGT